MPYLPKRLCALPGCSRPQTSGHRCEKHQRPAEFRFSEKHKSKPMPAASLYATAQWRHYSKQFLRDHPACFRCGSKAHVVDHALSSTERPDLFWEPANHRPACRSCHAYLSLHVNGVRTRREGRT